MYESVSIFRTRKTGSDCVEMSFVHIITNHEISAVQAIPIYSFYGSGYYELVNISPSFLHIHVQSTDAHSTHTHILEFEHIVLHK